MPFRKARTLSPVELEYLKSHKDYPINQLCIALANTRNQLNKNLALLSGKVSKATKSLPGNKAPRSNIGKRKDLNNQFFRSSWESNFFRFLKSNQIDIAPSSIEYEPTDFTFWQFGIKKGTVSYTPDFKLTYPDGTYLWVEIKGGFLRGQDKTKIRRFQKYYPDEASKLVAVTPGLNTKTALFFKEVGVQIKYIYPELHKKYKDTIPNWEK